MAGTIFLIVRLHGLFAVVMLGGIFSLLAASMFVVLDAVDVAFTEAAVGAGISTVLMLGALALTRAEEKVPSRQVILPLLTVFVAGAASGLRHAGYAVLRRSEGADPPACRAYYLADSIPKTTAPNVVTSVLASYRGYDTLGEVTVIFTAGVGVMLCSAAYADGAGQPGRGANEPSLILRVVAKLLIPFILLFGLYVQFHGDFGPGGGFQAGVIFASAFVLYALIYGVENPPGCA